MRLVQHAPDFRGNLKVRSVASIFADDDFVTSLAEGLESRVVLMKDGVQEFLVTEVGWDVVEPDAWGAGLEWGKNPAGFRLDGAAMNVQLFHCCQMSDGQ